MAPIKQVKGRIPKYIGSDEDILIRSSGTFSQTYKLKPMTKYTNLINEIKTTRPNVDRQNNIIVGIAVGIMISACSLIYLLTSLMSV